MPETNRSSRRRPLPRAQEQREEPTPEAREALAARAAREERAILIRRLRVLAFVFALFILVVLAQLVLTQLINITKLPQRVVAQAVDTSRGRITDRNGTLLATDIFSWEIYLDPSRYNPNVFKPEMVASAAQELGIDASVIMEAVAKPGKAVQIGKDVPYTQCQAAKTGESVPSWFWCDGKRKRSYPQSGLAAHLLGFADQDQEGLTGTEAYYNDWLRTSGTWSSAQLTGPATPIPQEWELFLPSVNGRDLVLHLSAPLQHAIEGHLVDALRKYDASSGSIIVLDPRSGGVLALANWPSFDPNNYAQADPSTWQNPTVSLLYEPGSVFKLITYAAALDAGSFTPDQQFNDAGRFEVGDQIIYNSERRKMGWVTGWQAFAESLNTVSAELSLSMGQENFYRSIRVFGFGRPTEIDLAAEVAGIVKRPGSEQWSAYDQAANSFGQGISTTPMQMINAAAAIANKGVLLQPQVAQALVYNGEVYSLPIRVLDQAMRPESARTLTQMMVNTVENYNRGKDLVPGFRIAGKTGTAEIPEQAGYTNPLTITSFVGFLPAANPQVVVLVKINEPKKSRWAEMVALPVFGEVARDVVQILRLTPNTDMP